MAETTKHEQKMTRGEASSYLRQLADELDGSGRTEIHLGNKSVHVSPADMISFEGTVTERKRALRSDTEEMSLTFKWTPPGEEE